MSDPSAPDVLLGATLGPYALVRKLGEGAMGAVYESRRPDGSPCAVKVLLPEIATHGDAVRRFFQEARTASSARSPHIVDVFDAGVDRAHGVPFLAMELLEGSDLEALLERVGPLDPVVAVRIALQLARGLRASHVAGIVHRDVKPGNVFLHAGAAGRVVVKLCDFGIAKSLHDEGVTTLTKTGTAVGTPLYMAPEQFKNSRSVDGRADVFALGGTLYRMLAGHAPHGGATSMAELIVRISSIDAPHLQDVAPWVESGLAALVHGLLARAPEDRCPSMTALERELVRFSGGSASVLRPMLAGIGAAKKEERAVRVRLPASWAEFSEGKGAERESASTPDPHGASGDRSGGDPLVGSRVGAYRLLRLIGSGGIGAVYEAEAPGGERVAVKVLLAAGAADGEASGRLVREARAMARVESRHIVRVLEADVDAATGRPFIAMELLRGEDVHQLVGRVGALGSLAVARIFLQACAGIEAAHRASIVHRDVKPANIFLHREASGKIIVKICDFGLAKSTSADALDAQSAHLTRTGGLLGSPVYMSPEQAKNAKLVDRRTDLWGLSVSMHEALTGQMPWSQCTSIGELILALCTERMPSLAATAPWVERSLAAAVDRGLEREVGERWQSAGELASALAPAALSSDDLEPDMLVAADRGSIAAEGSRSAVEPLADSRLPGGVTTTQATRSRPRVPLLAAALAGAVCAAGAFALLVARQPAQPAHFVGEPRATLANEPLEPVAPVEPVASEVEVHAEPAPTALEIGLSVAAPPGARVTVDGREAPWVAGKVSLRGKPGDRFDVVVASGSRRVARSVTITAAGTPEPPRLELVGGAAPLSGTATKASPSSAVGVPAAKPSASAKAAPAPTQPSAAPASTGIKIQEW